MKIRMDVTVCSRYWGRLWFSGNRYVFAGAVREGHEELSAVGSNETRAVAPNSFFAATLNPGHDPCPRLRLTHAWQCQQSLGRAGPGL